MKLCTPNSTCSIHPFTYTQVALYTSYARAKERRRIKNKRECYRESSKKHRRKERQRERARIKRCPLCQCIRQIRFMYITLLVASHWMLFIDLHTKFRWQEHASHLPLCEFNVYLIQHTMCTQIQPQFWQNRALYRIHTIAVFLSVSLSVCVYMIRCCLCYGCPKQKRISKQMYKNLSTLCQTNQSKMCCRRK